MGAGYHQFCPVAKAMELLDERWTLLVVRELCAGSERFNELRRGLPRMSPALLSRRLQQLTRAGVVTRTEAGGDVRYRLTAAGRELEPIVMSLGAWGARWVGRVGDDDLDPKLLLWDMHRHVERAAVSRPRVVLQFEFPELSGRARTWWLVVTADDTDVCDNDPGHPVDVILTATLRHLTEVWTGARSWTSALRGGEIRLSGDRAVCRAVPRLLPSQVFAPPG